MIFAPALRPFLERRPRALDLLEIEPQTLWLADDAFASILNALHQAAVSP